MPFLLRWCGHHLQAKWVTHNDSKSTWWQTFCSGRFIGGRGVISCCWWISCGRLVSSGWSVCSGRLIRGCWLIRSGRNCPCESNTIFLSPKRIVSSLQSRSVTLHLVSHKWNKSSMDFGTVFDDSSSRYTKWVHSGWPKVTTRSTLSRICTCTTSILRFPNSTLFRSTASHFGVAWLCERSALNNPQMTLNATRSKVQQEVQGPWRSAWQLQLGWHWQLAADLYQKLTAAN